MPRLGVAGSIVALFMLACPGAQAGLYPKSSPVLQVDAKDYERFIAKSNYTSVSSPLPGSIAPVSQLR